MALIQYLISSVIMSVYGGFPTRELETTYNMTVMKVLHLMANHVNQLFTIIKQSSLATEKHIETHEAFNHKLGRLKHRLKDLQERKYLQPKFSEAFGDKVRVRAQRSVTQQPQEGRKKEPVGSSIKRTHQTPMMNTIQEEYRFEYKSRNVKLKKLPAHMSIEVGQVEIPSLGPQSTRSDKRTILASGKHLRIYRQNMSRLRLQTEDSKESKH